MHDEVKIFQYRTYTQDSTTLSTKLITMRQRLEGDKGCLWTLREPQGLWTSAVLLRGLQSVITLPETPVDVKPTAYVGCSGVCHFVASLLQLRGHSAEP